MSASDERTLPPLAEFVNRRYAAHSPFWSWLLFERLGGALAWTAGRMGISPSALTLLGGACGIGGALVLGTAESPGRAAVAAALLLLAYTFDCADGQLARATGRAGPRGAWLDVVTDAVVIAFVAAALVYALTLHHPPGLDDLLVAGAFGASRTASLFTSTFIRQGHGGMRLSGVTDLLRTAFTATMDTPFVYVLLCATRLSADALEVVVIAISALTLVQTVVAGRHHFGSAHADVHDGT